MTTQMIRAILFAKATVATLRCQWRALPKDLPPVSTVQGYFYSWRDRGLFAMIRMLSGLLARSARELEGREASPTAGVIDSQSVKTTESGGIQAMTQRRTSKAGNATS